VKILSISWQKFRRAVSLLHRFFQLHNAPDAAPGIWSAATLIEQREK
jgi:hypothetical protein